MRKLTTSLLGLGLLLALTTAARADEQADARAIIEKAVAARGGLDKLARLKAGVTKTKGKIHRPDMVIEFTGTNTVVLPDKQRNEITAEVMGVPFEIVVVFDGKQGWRSTPMGLMEFSADQVAEQKHSMYTGLVSSLVPLLKDPGFKLKPLGETKLDGKAAVGVKVSKDGQRDVNLYFDAATGLPAKTETQAKDPQQGTEFKAEATFANWKDLDGVKHATKQTSYRDGKLFIESEILEAKALDKVDDKLFQKPSE